MALAKNFSIERTEIGTMTGTPGTRGIVLNGFQTELVRVTKLTGDTSGQIDLEAIQRPAKVYAIPLTNSSGTILTAQPTLSEVSFAVVDADTITVSGLGDWTAAFLIVCGRSYKAI